MVNCGQKLHLYPSSTGTLLFWIPKQQNYHLHYHTVNLNWLVFWYGSDNQTVSAFSTFIAYIFREVSHYSSELDCLCLVASLYSHIFQEIGPNQVLNKKFCRTICSYIQYYKHYLDSPIESCP